jgi:NAD(P)-dependent dehydrogenase (short-subunit alcohol dehydrogenase family)
MESLAHMPTIVITGANRGLGLEMSRLCAARDWTVMAGCRTPSDSLSALAASHPKVQLRRFDASDPDSLSAFAASFAPSSVDVLVHNAGTIGPERAEQSQDRLDSKGWLQTMQVNALAPLALSIAMRPALAAGAKIVAITSQLGSLAENDSGGLYAYRASKAALNMGMRSLAIDWRDSGLILLMLHPGWVRTDMGGPSAPLSPQESVQGMVRIIDAATTADHGRFLAYDGRALPW